MSERDGIQSFLAAVRRRLLLRAGLQAAGYGAAALGVGLFALGLSAAMVGPADFWPTVTACFAGALALVVLGGGYTAARALLDAGHHGGRQVLPPDHAHDADGEHVRQHGQHL